MAEKNNKLKLKRSKTRLKFKISNLFKTINKI